MLSMLNTGGAQTTHKQLQVSLDNVVSEVGQVLLGKQHVVRLAVACLISRGHLLIEDLPGMGKTLLSQLLAGAFGLEFKRIQFTSDLLPSDILGVSIYDRNKGTFNFQQGPLFTHVVLADEINRANPKTQSALLEAMEETQVTIEGKTLPLPDPFFVIATQNPSHQLGTFALPESQLDRFLMRIEIGYPTPAAERDLLKGFDRKELLKNMPMCLDASTLSKIQSCVTTIHVSSALISYVQSLLAYSRETSFYCNGLSPRTGLAIIRTAQAWALMEGRDFVLPEDIQKILFSVTNHRLQSASNDGQLSPTDIVNHLNSVAVV